MKHDKQNIATVSQNSGSSLKKKPPPPQKSLSNIKDVERYVIEDIWLKKWYQHEEKTFFFNHSELHILKCKEDEKRRKGSIKTRTG